MRKFFAFILTIFIATGCQKSINPSIMFKAPSDYTFSEQQTLTNIEYKIASNDIVGLSVYTNDGFKLIDVTASAASVSGGGSGASDIYTKYIVDIDGYLKLPIIGKVKVRDLTIRELQKLLEEQYTTYYNKPFVKCAVLNRRVLVFPGSGGAGKVVPIENENISLIEALALAGGIAETGKAYKIKLIRGDSRNPQVTMIDLSTVDGFKQGNTLLQANDIIYVEPIPKISEGVLAKLAPIVGILVSLLLIYDILSRASE